MAGAHVIYINLNHSLSMEEKEACVGGMLGLAVNLNWYRGQSI